MNPLKEFFLNKEVQLAWSQFILGVLDREALSRVYKGRDTLAVKEARDIISKSFKELNELFTEKPKPRAKSRAE